MNKQLDLFNPIQENGKSAYWNAFYKSTLERVEREKKQKEIQRIESQKPISIKQFIK
jgi:hypothetical protein